MHQTRRSVSALLAGMAAGPLLAQPAPVFPGKVIRIVPVGTAGGPIDVLAQGKTPAGASFDPAAPSVFFSAGNFLED